MLLVKYIKLPPIDLFHITPLLHSHNFSKEQENAERWIVAAGEEIYNQNYYQIASHNLRNCTKTPTQEC